jgi:hypothetical protein
LSTSRSPPVFETKNDLNPAIRQEAIELLIDRLADCIDLHTQVKHAHWNVMGPEFIALRKLFYGINDAVVETALVRGGASAIGAVTANPQSVGRRQPARIDTDLSS